MEIKPAPEQPRRIILKHNSGLRQIVGLSKPGQFFPPQVMSNQGDPNIIKHFALVQMTKRMVIYRESTPLVAQEAAI